MKKLSGALIIVLMALVVVSCNSGPGKKLKEAKEQASDIGNIVKNLDDLEEKTKDNSARVEELKKITPFTNEKMTGWMPEELNGMKRASYSVSSAIGTSQCDLRFENEAKDKSITVTIIDGAGEVGSNFYSSQVLMMETLKNMSSESDDKTEKVVKRNGSLTYETYYKSENRSYIQVVMEDRFIVSVDAQGMNPDETWAAIEKINFKGLI